MPFFGWDFVSSPFATGSDPLQYGGVSSTRALGEASFGLGDLLLLLFLTCADSEELNLLSLMLTLTLHRG